MLGELWIENRKLVPRICLARYTVVRDGEIKDDGCQYAFVWVSPVWQDGSAGTRAIKTVTHRNLSLTERLETGHQTHSVHPECHSDRYML